MSVRNDNVDKKLEINLQDGTSPSGATIIKKINFSNVRMSATDDELYDAYEAYGALTTRTLMYPYIWNKGLLTKEE